MSEKIKINYISKWLRLPQNLPWLFCHLSQQWYNLMGCPLEQSTEEKKCGLVCSCICILNWHHLEVNGSWKTALCRFGYEKQCWKESFRTLSKYLISTLWGRKGGQRHWSWCNDSWTVLRGLTTSLNLKKSK